LLALQEIEAETLDLSSQSGAYDLSATDTRHYKPEFHPGNLDLILAWGNPKGVGVAKW